MLDLAIFMSFRIPNRTGSRPNDQCMVWVVWLTFLFRAPANNISSLTDMSDQGHEAAPPRSLAELMDAACDFLEQYRERGMPNTVERNMLDRTFTESNSSRLQALVARFEKAIQVHAHDARMAACTALRHWKCDWEGDCSGLSEITNDVLQHLLGDGHRKCIG